MFSRASSTIAAVLHGIREHLPTRHHRRAEDEDAKPEPRVFTAGVWFCIGAAAVVLAQDVLQRPQAEPAPSVTQEVADYHFRLASQTAQWCATEQPR